MKISRALIGTLLFFLNFIFIYLIHINFLKVNVIFYSALIDAIISTSITGLILYKSKFFQILGNFEKNLIIIVWILLGYSFAISGPTVIDRSLSFYILEKIDQRGGGIRLDAMEQVFVQEYMPEYRLIDVRLTEQLESGTIEIKDGCVLLTEKGKFITKLSEFIRHNLLAKQRLLMGEYTDDLTDPFRNSTQDVNYKCKAN